MSCKITDLYCKEVICVCDGRRLGFVCDAVIQVPEGRILSIIVPCPSHFLSLLGRRDDFIIPWECICKIGPDIILVDIKPDQCRVPRSKPGLLFGF